MKAILIVIVACIFWILVGHFAPLVSIFATAFYLPLVFGIAFYIDRKINKYGYVVFCFLSILLNDYLFRIYGGGIHDDAGRGICEIVFYATLITSTITLLAIKMTHKNTNKSLTFKTKVINALFVLSLSMLTFCFFRNFNISI
jgi:hypothetical protein